MAAPLRLAGLDRRGSSNSVYHPEDGNMKSKNMTLMAIAIGCGLVAAFLTAKLSGGNAPETIDVIVAKKELPVGTTLEAAELDNMLMTQKIDKKSLPPDIINSADELKGKKLNRTLKAGNMFSQGDVGVDAGIKMPEGMSKYAIKMEGVKAVAGFVQPGDKVDVMLTESQANGKAKSGVFLSDMLILAVDTRARRSENGEAVQQVNSVSLAVTPDEALYLSSAEKRGEVKLLLRNTTNTAKTSVNPKSSIPGFDESQEQAAIAPPMKLVPIVVAKADIAQNTQVTKENFNNFFATKDVPEEGLTSKAIKDPTAMYGKYIKGAIEADQQVFNSQLSNDKIEEPKVVVAEAPKPVDELEILPFPREIVSLYPRKFEQILNNRRVIFLETGPGQFRQVDGQADGIKELPSLDAKQFKKEEKTEEKPRPGDLPV